ncbi:CHAD domain-containing protein [Pseudofrankia sp. DC12]|uniref:CHAD domain-containing protein n=1 Tax=Pseudofrankia sp. DC12 TaxID=683315 RepID=UPI000A03CF75|nr:CHAD domain-containing protein [Pseudofrankia sp. DC12]
MVTLDDGSSVNYSTGANARYVDLGSTLDPAEQTYSYNSLEGSLDHVLANPAALTMVTSADVWQGNAQEAVAFAYSRYNWLRSTLRTFHEFFAEAPSLALQARPRDLNLLLNAARDGEVQLERFMTAIDALDDRDVRGPVAAQVQGHLGSEHLRGRERALAWMRGGEYLGFVDDLVAFVTAPPYSPLGQPPAGAALRAPVRRADRKLRRRAGLALRAPEGDRQDAALHAARKAAKRLRYAAETIRPVHGMNAAKLARRAKRIQDTLGEHQDCVVAQGVLREFATAANGAGESSFTYGLLLGGEQEHARRIRDAFAARWPKVAGRGHRRWLR